ncbi:MAG: hypothetical protein BAJALOKI2v1_240014 [Promethearchaeota archaeon]|nr:MAG: hypothetical protein BAJALOKI2v1_240014 [Candidatus Lokiarchaeota archaeon]
MIGIKYEEEILGLVMGKEGAKLLTHMLERRYIPSVEYFWLKSC